MSERPVTVCLYQAITQGGAHRTYSATRLDLAKSLVRNGINDVATRVTGRMHLDRYHYLRGTRRSDESNKGDIGIGLAVREQIEQALAPRAVEFVEVMWGNLDDKTIEQLNGTCDLFVIGGGGYIFVDGAGRLNERAVDLELLGKIRVPIIAYSIGLNRLLHEQENDLTALPDQTQRTLQSFADTFALLSVRDGDTKMLFDRYTFGEVALTADPALFLGRRHRKPLTRSKKFAVGINLAAHSWRAVHVLNAVLPSILPLLRKLARTPDLELVYFVHHDLELPVVALLKRNGIPLQVVDTDPVSMLDAYAQVDFVLCQMLHSAIFATNAGTPFLNIAYDLKSVAFAALLNTPEAAISYRLASEGWLDHAFGALFERRLSLRSQIEASKIELFRELQTFQSRIGDLIDTSAVTTAWSSQRR